MKPDKIDQFLEKLLEEKEITDLRPGTKKEVLARMRQVLLSQTEKEILSRLPQEQATILVQKMSDSKLDDEEVAAFLREAGIDVDEVMDKTMELYRKFYLEEA